MFGWARVTVVFASSTKRATNSSSHARSSRICLTTSFFSKPPAPRSVASTTRAIPPRASSRSRTYLPKTWGYIGPAMGRVHRSKRTQLSFAVAMAGVACHNADIVTRVVTMHVPPGCPSGGQALDGSGYVTLEGLGDFEPTLSPSGHLLKNVGDTLSEIDPASQALEINATEGAGKWLGVAAVPAQGSLDVLLLPFLSSCPLPAPVGVLGPSVPV